MKLRFTATALRQLDHALSYVAERSPKGAASVRQELSSIFTLLEGHPHIGKATNRPGVRRLIVPRYPYVIFYRTAPRKC